MNSMDYKNHKPIFVKLIYKIAIDIVHSYIILLTVKFEYITMINEISLNSNNAI